MCLEFDVIQQILEKMKNRPKIVIQNSSKIRAASEEISAVQLRISAVSEKISAIQRFSGNEQR